MSGLPISNIAAFSPVRDLLGTNTPITPSQVDQITQHLVEPLKDLASLTLDIDTVRNQLAALEEQRKCLEDHIQAHQALMRPIRVLPDEILQEIFAHCLPAHHLPVLRPSTAPLLLTQICQSWRVLAGSTPSLWYGLHIAVPTANSLSASLRANTNRILAVKQWLARARTQQNGSEGKLHVGFYWSSRVRPCPGTSSWFSSSLRDCAARICVLELDLPDNKLFPFMDAFSRPDRLFDQRDTVLPNMKKLVLHLPCAPGQASRGRHVASRKKFWRECSGLKEIAWYGVDDDIFKLALNWSTMEGVRVSCSGARLVNNEQEPAQWGGLGGVHTEGGGLSRETAEMSFFTHEEALNLARGAPRLRRLALQLNFEDSTRRAEIPVKETRNQSSGSDTANLEDDYPDHAVWDPADRVADGPIRLEYLKELTLGDTYLDAYSIPLFLLGVRLPQLTALHYELAGFPPRGPSWQTMNPGMEEWRGHDGDPTHPLLWFLNNQLQDAMSFGVARTSVGAGLKITRLRIHAGSISQYALVLALKSMMSLEDLWVLDSGDLSWRTQEYLDDLEEDEVLDPWEKEKERGEAGVFPDDVLLTAFVPPSLRRVFAPYSDESREYDTEDSEDESVTPTCTSQTSTARNSSNLASRLLDSEPAKDDIADGSETLCPCLISLRFDRTVFSLDSLRSFVEARNRLAESSPRRTTMAHLGASRMPSTLNLKLRKIERLWIGFLYPRPDMVDSSASEPKQCAESAFKDLGVTPHFRFAEPDTYRRQWDRDIRVNASEGLRWNS